MRKVNKKNERIFKGISIVLAILILLVMAFLVFEIYTLGFFPASILMPAIMVIVVMGVLAACLQIFFTRRRSARTFITILTCLVLCIYSVGAFYISKATGLLDRVTANDGKRTIAVQAITMASSPMENQQDLVGQNVGVLSSISKPATDAMVADLAGQNISINQHPYDSIQALVKGLYDGEVSAIILNEAYRANITDLEDEQFRKFDQDTKVLYTYTYTTQQEATTKKVDNITTTPFTVLISGVDSRSGFSESSRSDVNMLATVNPNTKTVLLTSIPRDYYVTTVCDPDLGCQNGAKDKLTHTGLHSVETTKQTIENLLGITINYTAQVNFSSVVNLVDALGGIEVNVQPGLAVDHFWTNDYFGTDYGVTEGINHLNGQAALCYARERYAYADGDRQRVRNQQEVLMQIVKKASSPAVITSFPSLMDAMSGAFLTDLSGDEIQDLVQFQLKNSPQWQFITYALDGSGSTEFCAELGNNAYVMIPYPETIQTAKERIDAVLAGKTPAQVEGINADGSNVPAQSESALSNQSDTSSQEEQPVYSSSQEEQQVYTDPYVQTPDYTAPDTQEPVYTDPYSGQSGYKEQPVYTEPAYGV